MIRTSAILLLIITAALAAVPSVPQTHSNQVGVPMINLPVLAGDPNATVHAFNYTYSQANLYTNTSATPPKIFPPTFPASNMTGIRSTWLNTVTRTSDGTLIANTGFRFNLTQANLVQGKEEVNWTLSGPRFNCKACTGISVNFDFFGTLTKGTNASYALYLAPPNSTKPVGGTQCCQAFSTIGNFPLTTGGCPETFCIPVPSNYIGYNMTLSFTFGWNANATLGMFADLGEITVAAIGNFFPSVSHYMQQDPLNSNLIRHTTVLRPIIYNNTLTTHLQPGNVSRTMLWWKNEVISIYYPSGYKITSVSLNNTQLNPSPPKVPFEADNCVIGTGCSESLLALNMSDFNPAAIHNSTITIISTTQNSLSSLTTLQSGAPTRAYAPADTIGVKAVNSPAIANATATQKTGNLTLTFFDHAGATHVLSGQTFPTLTALGGVYDLTLPSDCSGNNCGTWNIFANFTSRYDMGLLSTSFSIGQMLLNSFSTSGSNLGLNVQGSLTYLNNTPATSATSVVFAVDSETQASLPVTTSSYTFSGRGLYVTNTSLVNGVFGQGQSLIMTFTIVNSIVYANNTSPPFNATITIDHEWPGVPPLTHGVQTNFTLGKGHLGDQSFTNGPQSYEAVFTIGQNGTQLRITSLTTGNPENVAMTLGTSPVPSTEPHAGLFNITLIGKSHGVTNSTSSILTAPYAYVFGLPLGSSKYLAYSKPFTGASLSTTLASDRILGAKRMTVFTLARDPTGVILSGSNQNPGFTDSTTVQANMDTVGEVAINQHATAILHLTSNSTTVTQTLTVNLNLQGSGAVANQTITLAPGASQMVTLPFIAPPTTGQYTISFSSPQYLGNIPLASQTLRVTILQSNLQILIPAAIGIIAAIIVLGVYLIRGRTETPAEEVTKTKPTGPKPKSPGAKDSSKSLTQTQAL